MSESEDGEECYLMLQSSYETAVAIVNTEHLWMPPHGLHNVRSFNILSVKGEVSMSPHPLLTRFRQLIVATCWSVIFFSSVATVKLPMF